MIKQEKSHSIKLYLYLDTTGSEAVIALVDEHKEFVDKTVWSSEKNQSEELLQKVDQFLLKNGVNKNDLIGFIANTGPGSYTGLRVGLTAVNFLGFSLNRPVIGLEAGDLSKLNFASRPDPEFFQGPIYPIYFNSPHITQKKSRL